MASDTTPASRAHGDAPQLDTNARLLAGFRILIGAMWVSNVGWKEPPDFGSLKGFTGAAVEHPVWQPYSWIVEHLILPNFVPFGWTVLVIEGVVGAMLLAGLCTRAFALVGAVMSTTIMLSVAQAPHEWPWAYYLMIGGHLAVFAAAAGRAWGLDALIRPIARSRPGRAGRLLMRAT